MGWEQTDISMAAKTGRIAELHAEGDRARQVRDLVRKRQSNRLASVTRATVVPVSKLWHAIAGIFGAPAREPDISATSSTSNR